MWRTEPKGTSLIKRALNISCYFVISAFLSFALLYTLTGCSPVTVPYTEELVNIAFDCTDGEYKTVTAEIDTETAYYTYTAEALFTLSDGSYVYGDTEGKEVRIGTTGAEIIGPFTQGKWRFHVYAYNQDDGLIRDGGTDFYIRKLDTSTPFFNSIPVTIYRTALRTGNVHFLLTTTQVSSEKPYVKVTPTRQGEAKAERIFYATKTTEDEATFEFTLTGLQPGGWEFAFETYDNDVKEGGATVQTYILGNDTTEISGEIYPTEWIHAGFDITMPTQITGSIGDEMSLKPGTYNFQWYPSGGEPVQYRWSLNGVDQKKGTSNTFSYNFQNPGVYTVTCVAVDKTGTEMGYSSCTVNILTTEQAKTSGTWKSPTAGSYTLTLPGTVTKKPTMRLLVEDTVGSILYSGYPSLSGTTGNWKATATYTQNSETVTTTIVLTGTTATITHSKDISGTVVLEVSL